MTCANPASRTHPARRPPLTARRTRAAIALATLAAIATPTLVGTAEAASRTTLDCRSGKTVFHEGSVRAFYLKHHLRSQPSLTWRSYYACRPGSRKPRLLYESSPATFTDVYGFRIFGVRLGFVVTTEGYGGGGDALVGWFDLRIGQLRSGVINVNEEQYTPATAPHVPIGEIRYAIAPNGTVAVLGEDEPEQEIALLTVGASKLRAPVRLFYTTTGSVDPSSLAISETAVTWRTRSGQTESAPI
jgi:hypothetical protein